MRVYKIQVNMESCELCGKVALLSKAKVAGTTMQLCSSCKSHGVLENKTPKSKVFRKTSKDLSSEFVVNDFHELISAGLQKKGLNSHQLAKAINLKESSLHKFITGKLQPDIDTAKRIGAFLEINLIDNSSSSVDMDEFIVDEESTDEVTNSLGDLLKEELKRKNKK